jgi:hypothetical protein
MRILLRIVVLTGLAATYLALVPVVFDTGTGDANIGAGLIGFGLLSAATGGWALVDGGRLGFATGLWPWALVVPVSALLMAVGLAVREPDLPVRSLLADISGTAVFLTLMLGTAALVGGCLGAVVHELQGRDGSGRRGADAS